MDLHQNHRSERKEDYWNVCWSEFFPSKTGIGFYISYPWLKWPEAFTDTLPEDYDAELQRQELLPTEEAGDYMWFMDNAGFMTACDPVHKPRQEKDKANDVTVGKRILGMGFHIVNALDKVVSKIFIR